MFYGSRCAVFKGQAPFTTEYLPFFRKGDDGGGDTPLPIPNREVKPASADGTAGQTPWESRSSPIFYCHEQGLVVSGPEFGLGLVYVGVGRRYAGGLRLRFAHRGGPLL